MQPRQAHRRVLVLLGAAAVSGLALHVDAADGGASAAVETAVAVERAMAIEQADRLAEISQERVSGARELAELYRRLDAVVTDVLASDSATVAGLLREIERAERDRSQVLTAQSGLVEKLVDHLRRAELLEERITDLRDRDREAAGPLAGRWEVVMLPNERRGVFALTQTGTLVSGTYQLEGGWTGSLQGTLVNRKVFLVRIDSRLGRTMEYEGRLSDDGTVIRGSWLDYELAAGGASEGQWTATRVEE